MAKEMTNERAIAYLDGLPADKLVLHGAHEEYDVLRPSQPNQSHLIPEYNQCAVYGTLFTDIALLHAVIRAPKTDWGWEVDFEKTPYLTVRGPKRLPIGVGYIHILRQSDFTSIVEPGFSCLAFKEVVPIRVIAVWPNILELLHVLERVQFP